MAGKVQEIGGIFPVMNRETGIEADLLRIVAQDSRADPMERAGPCQCVGHDARVGAHRQGADALDAARHLGSRPTGESHQQDAARIGAVDDQMGDAMGERVSLARSRPGDDQERARRRAVLLPDAMLDGLSLFGIEFFEIGQGRRLRIGVWSRSYTEPHFSFCSQCARRVC